MKLKVNFFKHRLKRTIVRVKKEKEINKNPIADEIAKI